MTSRQERQAGERVKQQRKKSLKGDHENKKTKPLEGVAGNTSYDQTASSARPLDHASQTSQYQSTSSTDLPSATTWPNGTTIPDQTEMDYNLLGLSLEPPQSQHRHAGYPYDQMTHWNQSQNNVNSYPRPEPGTGWIELQMAATQPGYDMTGMDRWISELPSQQGAILAWDKDEELARK
ncbi:hypothetical protein VTL71DRAFT_15348 [Oculimacula yallundae]|uniref:Uncharacterized protein n=1 Tax=Oculimacula yallundae TaxID=86028 RepID=A0ABR4CGX7_9HELO